MRNYTFSPCTWQNKDNSWKWNWGELTLEKRKKLTRIIFRSLERSRSCKRTRLRTLKRISKALTVTRSSYFLFFVCFGWTLKRRCQRENATAGLPSPHHSYLAETRRTPAKPMRPTGLSPPLHFRLISVFFLFFEHFWRKLCIWQSEILCWVTYSVQFKVPLFLLHSAGIGSHRGAVQPLHCRGSDCRGRQRERERFDICILQPRPHQTDPRVGRRHPSTRSSSTCHHKQKKFKNPNTSPHTNRDITRRVGPSEGGAAFHALKGRFLNFEWI